eukprot:g20450.t1
MRPPHWDKTNTPGYWNPGPEACTEEDCHAGPKPPPLDKTACKAAGTHGSRRQRRPPHEDKTSKLGQDLQAGTRLLHRETTKLCQGYQFSS